MRPTPTTAASASPRWAGEPVIDTLRLTAEDASGLLERGEVSGEELAGAYLDAIEARDAELHAYLHVVGERGDGVPIAHKDVITTKGIPTTAGSKILVGYTPQFDSDGRGPLQGRRAAHHREDQPGRVRDGLVHGELRLRPDEEPVGSGAGAGRVVRRVGGRRRRRARALGARHRHGRLGKAAGLALRRRRPAPDLRHGLALRDRRLRVQPRPGRPADEDRARQRAPVRAHRRQGPGRLDDGRAARARVHPGERGPDGPPHRRPQGDERGRGDRPRRGRERERRHPPRRGARRRASRRRASRARSTTASPATTSSPRRRRAPTSPATTASATAIAPTPTSSPRSTRAPAGRASGPSRSGASSSGRTRSRPATTTPTTARPRRCARSSPRSMQPSSSAST